TRQGGIVIADASSVTRWIVLIAFLSTATATAEPVRVRFSEGLVHGFLTLRTTDGAAVADGDLIQSARAGRVTTRLVFRFTDRSVRDETAVFTQTGVFRLASVHLVQKGPTTATRSKRGSIVRRGECA